MTGKMIEADGYTVKMLVDLDDAVKSTMDNQKGASAKVCPDRIHEGALHVADSPVENERSQSARSQRRSTKGPKDGS